jgi:hypothetical protein
MGSVLIALLSLAPFFDWAVALLLIRATIRYPHVKALRERALIAVAIAVGVTTYFLAAFNAAWGYPVVDLGGTQLIARLSVMAIGMMPLYWLWLYVHKGWSE